MLSFFLQVWRGLNNNMQINKERLAQYFTELCEIESPSKKEEEVSRYIQAYFSKLGADSISIDESADQTGSETGNLIVRFTGDEKVGDALFFACHMDTVGPVEGVKVVREGNIFTSAGETTLGSDDKSGIASLFELFALLKENSIPHCPIELVFTTCEEIGLLGAKAFDTSILQAKYGYALDSTKKDKIIIGAPAANRLEITVRGKAAHSGSAPEEGVNALMIAAEAITKLKLGRIDKLSTANFGVIQGGTATNIIPEQVVLKGEVRSHSPDLLERHTATIIDTFHKTVGDWPCSSERKTPSVVANVTEEFPVMSLVADEPALLRIHEAATKNNRVVEFDIAGGGSDANIFCGNGLTTAILPTGMDKVHTTDEQIDLNDMVNLTELLFAMVT